MVEVIVDRSKKYDIKCSACRSSLRCGQHDLKTHLDFYYGELHTISEIQCPVCEKEVLVLIDNKEVNK